MKFARALFAVCAALTCWTPAFAQEPQQEILPESLSIPLVAGSTVPADCMYPASITDQGRFETACVTMPRFNSGDIAAQYIGFLGEQGWHRGNYISGGFTAVHTDANDCEEVINIFPSDFPPGTENAGTVVIWFARERAPRCGAQQTP